MNALKFKNLLLPLSLVSVLATGLTFTQPGFWYVARWIILALLAAYLLFRSRPLSMVSPLVVFVSFAYVTWCVATVAWSEVPTLSSAKLLGLVLVGFATLWGGHYWVASHNAAESLNFLWPWAVLSIFAGLIPGNTETFGRAGLTLYAGSTANPNTLGGFIALSLPFVVWKLYQNYAARTKRHLWMGVLVVSVLILYLSGSRSSYLIFLGVSFGFLISGTLHRSVVVSSSIVWAALFLTLVAPQVSGSWIQRMIYKQAEAGIAAGITDSRLRSWEESTDAASKGGWLGVGYGVAAGSDVTLLVSAFTTAGYGREKGNSQLAILEETGIVGLLFYVILLVVLFATLWKRLSRVRGEQRVLVGLVIGTLLGMLAQSSLEAWWSAPGSSEFVYFWSLAGAGLGMTRSLQTPMRRPSAAELRLAYARQMRR